MYYCVYAPLVVSYAWYFNISTIIYIYCLVFSCIKSKSFWKFKKKRIHYVIFYFLTIPIHSINFFTIPWNFIDILHLSNCLKIFVSLLDRKTIFVKRLMVTTKHLFKFCIYIYTMIYHVSFFIIPYIFLYVRVLITRKRFLMMSIHEHCKHEKNDSVIP